MSYPHIPTKSYNNTIETIIIKDDIPIFHSPKVPWKGPYCLLLSSQVHLQVLTENGIKKL